MKVIVQFSGGKDSLASLLWALDKYGVDNVTAVFCDTKWEHNLTYGHINEVVKKSGVEFVTLFGMYSFMGLVRKKLRFPSTKARFCTEWLKIRPFIDWLLEQDYPYFQIIQGIRRSESKSRSKMDRACTYFKYYFEPYKHDKNGKPVFMTYRKKEVREWCLKHQADIDRPFIDASANDVMNFIKSKGYKPNPLYYMGFGRVGCFPCIMCNHSEMKLIIEKQPEYLERIQSLEQEMGSTFFPPDYIPKYAQQKFNSIQGIKKLPALKSVIDYLKGKRGTMFDATEEPKSCMSIYNICE